MRVCSACKANSHERTSFLHPARPQPGCADLHCQPVERRGFHPARAGTPLVNTRSRFLKTASYGDTLAVHVTVKEWRDKSFVQAYRITREDDLIMECEEVRIFATTRNDGKNSIRAVPIPPSIRLLCE